MVHVFEHQYDGLALTESLEQSQDRLEHARLAPLGRDDTRPVWQQLQRREPRAQTRHQPGDRIGRRSYQGGERFVGNRRQEMIQGRADRRVGHSRRGRQGDPVD